MRNSSFLSTASVGPASFIVTKVLHGVLQGDFLENRVRELNERYDQEGNQYRADDEGPETEVGTCSYKSELDL